MRGIYQHGISLIELVIGLVIFAMLFALALPNYREAIQNAQIRTAAESIVNGLQIARAEAVRRNRQVQLTLLNTLDGAATAGGTDWKIMADDQTIAGTANFTIAIQQRSSSEGSQNARIGVKASNSFTSAATPGSGLPGTITFTGLGRLTTGTTISQIDISSASNGNVRRLAITINSAGQIRLCDPALSLSSNPQGCV